MGIVALNYIVQDEIIDKIKNTEFDLFEYFEKELMTHEYNNDHFQKEGILFGALVKAWSPMYELIKFLDSSEKKILNKIGNKSNYLPENENNDSMYIYYSSEVKEIWSELKNISIGKIEEALNDSKTVERISNIDGYWNERIERKQHIIMEFFELYNAFYEANKKTKGIITTLE